MKKLNIYIIVLLTIPLNLIAFQRSLSNYLPFASIGLGTAEIRTSNNILDQLGTPSFESNSLNAVPFFARSALNTMADWASKNKKSLLGIGTVGAVAAGLWAYPTSRKFIREAYQSFFGGKPPQGPPAPSLPASQAPLAPAIVPLLREADVLDIHLPRLSPPKQQEPIERLMTHEPARQTSTIVRPKPAMPTRPAPRRPQAVEKSEDFHEAKQLLSQIEIDLKKLKKEIENTLRTNTFDTNSINTLIKSLHEEKNEIIHPLKKLTTEEKQALQEQARNIIHHYEELLAETSVLDLWTHGYNAYEKDLAHNFRRLPIKASVGPSRPNIKKLYEELGFTAEEIPHLSFAMIRNKYQEQYDNLKAMAGEDFDDTYFRPYLRALDLIFRTPYNKLQYDAYQQGPDVFNAKTKTLAADAPAIQKLFEQYLPSLRTLTGLLESELSLSQPAPQAVGAASAISDLTTYIKEQYGTAISQPRTVREIIQTKYPDQVADIISYYKKGKKFFIKLCNNQPIHLSSDDDVQNMVWFIYIYTLQRSSPSAKAPLNFRLRGDQQKLNTLYQSFIPSSNPQAAPSFGKDTGQWQYGGDINPEEYSSTNNQWKHHEITFFSDMPEHMQKLLFGRTHDGLYLKLTPKSEIIPQTGAGIGALWSQAQTMATQYFPGSQPIVKKQLPDFTIDRIIEVVSEIEPDQSKKTSLIKQIKKGTQHVIVPILLDYQKKYPTNTKIEILLEILRTQGNDITINIQDLCETIL